MPPTPNQAILVVDDDETLRSTVRDILTEEGYSVRDAPDGSVGLNMLRAQPGRFGLVLLDLMMPRTTGWEFRLEQREDPAIADIPVVVLSASVNVNRDGLPVDVTPDAFLPKPFDLPKLLDMVERFIGPSPHV
jgi:CheY-like chemotaxis protein